jgi:hypothetical protein
MSMSARGIGSSSHVQRGCTPLAITKIASTTRFSARFIAATRATASGTTARGKPTLRSSDSRSTIDVTPAPVTSEKKKYRIIASSRITP